MFSTSVLSVSEARQTMLAELVPVSDSETVPLHQALGRVLKSSVCATLDIPPFDNSAMDGYAVCSADLSDQTETRLSIIGTALAGKIFPNALERGEAVRIMTGAVLPSGADTVIMQEVVCLDGNVLVVPPGQRAGQHVRHAGESLAKGKPALLGGKRLSAADLGLLASIGIPEVKVLRPLRVAIMSTGDELTPLDQPLACGQIFDANRYSLLGLLSMPGIETIDFGIVRDTPEALEVALREAADKADVIVTSGGVSVGEADFVRDLVSSLGEIRFWKLKIKPGKPMAFGRVGKAWFFGLPGNPVAVMVAFQIVVRDALLALMGCSPLPEHPTFKVPCASPFKRVSGRQEYLRGFLFEHTEGWRVRLLSDQGSGALISMSQANCFVVIPENQENVSEGDLVDVRPFSRIEG